MFTLIFENGQKMYQDNFGNKYQYDLTNSLEKLSYYTDISAQMRDSLSTTSTRNLNGGGIYE